MLVKVIPGNIVQFPHPIPCPEGAAPSAKQHNVVVVSDTKMAFRHEKNGRAISQIRCLEEGDGISLLFFELCLKAAQRLTEKATFTRPIERQRANAASVCS